MKTFERISSIFSLEKKQIFLFILFVIFSSLLDLLSLGLIAPLITSLLDPELFSRVYKFLLSDLFFIKSTTKNVTYLVCFAILFLFFLKFFLVYFLNKFIFKLSLNEQVKNRIKVLNLISNLDYSEFRKKNKDYFFHSVYSLPQEFTGVIVAILRTIAEFAVALTLMIFLAFYNLKILLTLITIGLFSFVIYYFIFRIKLEKYGAKINEGTIKIISFVRSFSLGFREILVLSKEKFFKNNIITGSYELANNQLKINLIQVMPRYMLEFVLILIVIVIIIFTFQKQSNETLILPILATYGVASIRIFPFLNIFLSTLLLIKSKTDSIKRLHSLLYEIKNKKNKSFSVDKLSKNFESLKFKNISYRFPKTKNYLLKKINLNIKKGDKVLIFGKSGSGKSTLINLLCGLVQKSSGQIELNKKIQHYVLQYMKRNCFLLTQDNFIVNLSIAENITLDLKSKINQNILKKSIKLANIDQNIIYRKHKTNLDDLNTESSISGGEKQRVSIARGFYSNRELFILDEPTSNLDPKNTAKIISNIMLELKKKTVIVISHDHLAISKFNKIFKLENGHLKKIK